MCVWAGGGGGRGVLSEFFVTYKESKSTHFLWGEGERGSVARGSVARVSEFFLQ